MSAEPETNGLEWFVHDEDGLVVILRGTVDGGLAILAGDESAAGLVVLDDRDARRFVAASWDLLEGSPVAVGEEVRDVMPEHFPFPWWAADTRAGDGVRRGVVLSRTEDRLVVVAGRVRSGGRNNTGAASLEPEDAGRLAEAALAILEGRDPWEVSP